MANEITVAMTERRYKHQGFSLVELIAVIVIVAVLSVSVASRFGQSSVQRLHASRDLVVAALFAAQQRAMAQVGPVRIIISGSQVDIRQNNGSGYQSIRVGGIQYPVGLFSSQTISGGHTFDYNRLGQVMGAASNTNITLSQGSSSLIITLSPSGFSQ